VAYTATALLYIQEDSNTQGEEIHPGIVFIFNANNQVVGIEFLPASKVLAPGAIDSLPTAAE
jgi:uncharacterized protein YuzE